jgi:hypothetical protein
MFAEQFGNSKYPKIDPEDYDDYPWMIYCLKESEKERLSALELFINLSKAKMKF